MEQDNTYIINTPSVKIKSITVGYILVILAIAWIAAELLSSRYGYKEIGVRYERREYSTQYWVYLQPDNAETKNYRVKGDIERFAESDGDLSYAVYALSRVYWEDGGYTEFDDCDITEATDKDKHAYCMDSEGKGYDVRLGEKVKQ